MTSVLEQAMAHAAKYEAELAAANKRFGNPVVTWIEQVNGQYFVKNDQGGVKGPFFSQDSALKVVGDT
jgi:hypothetical protein